MGLERMIAREDLTLNKMAEVEVNGKKILLVNYQDNVKAFQPHCPHQGASLVKGQVKQGFIVCPVHQRMYSFETGKHNFTSECLKTYTAIEKDGYIFIDTDELNG